ncbi:prolipoprotein diacylglyceryl transferase family protein [Clostridium grantii]|uniref:Prolipoprotein diacylglyceryl transferase n=1 Tax=Clostridium grantii DSM 8605 TaxID=1121316 RepID=A0A1M5VEW4_9CLOT|nr:prolipoprotein diacylglyceryl transferase family protein [Clostridium grantii]SHH73799.1 Prolipoprotein diacylglyceryl transferase [Clostridium grantii DSM 8605]
MHPNINFSFFGQQIVLKSYSTFMVLSMTIGFLLSCYLLRKKTYKWSEILCIYLLIIIFFLLGARGLNYFVNYKYFRENNISFFLLKTAYFSLYGGIVVAFLVSILINKIIKKNIKVFLDTLTTPFFISFIIMRIGCFLNGCCGGKHTNSFLGVQFPHKDEAVLNGIIGSKLIQSIYNGKSYPTQLFEGGFALLFILVVLLLRKKIKLKESVFFILSAMYFSAFRWFVLYFRILPYEYYITRIFYPVLYFSIILIGVIKLFIDFHFHHEKNTRYCKKPSY